MVESQSTALPLGYTRQYMKSFVQLWIKVFMAQERIAGIEPAPLAWKARALPLCNIRIV